MSKRKNSEPLAHWERQRKARRKAARSKERWEFASVMFLFCVVFVLPVLVMLAALRWLWLSA